MARKKKEIISGAETQITPRRRTKSSQKKLIELQQADGKIYNKHSVKSIDELLGFGSSKYLTSDEKRYEEYISNMNTSDLQAHATKVGVMPNYDRNILVKRLLKEFRISNSSRLNTAQEINPIKKKIKQETLDILSEGR